MMQRRSSHRAQRGVTILVVLVLLSVMLLGGLAMARMTETRTLASGNTAFREASLQATEVGLNEAYAALRVVGFAEDDDAASWYWATAQPADADAIPKDIIWDDAPEIVVGNYRVRYVVERLCTVTPVTSTLRECLVRQVPQMESNKAMQESVDPPNARQFRVTVRVTGPKDTQTWIQSLVTRG
jgi:type IV pilus assembly protein PilX